MGLHVGQPVPAWPHHPPHPWSLSWFRIRPEVVLRADGGATAAELTLTLEPGPKPQDNEALFDLLEWPPLPVAKLAVLRSSRLSGEQLHKALLAVARGAAMVGLPRARLRLHHAGEKPPQGLEARAGELGIELVVSSGATGRRVR